MRNFFKLSVIAVSALLLTNVYGNEHKGTHWGYSGEIGPSNWGKLDKKFHMCSEGKVQSPIDVKATKDVDLAPLDIKYTKGSKNIVNNGHAVQVNMQDGNKFIIDGKEYDLKQFHFHTPSENHINGKSFPMEAHFVHATKDGNLAVIAVVFKEGDANPAFEKIVKSFPIGENKEKELALSKDDVNSILPSNKDYYKFMGSLTTPPCSENVKWFVIKTPQNVSKEQIEAMQKEIGKKNNRPIQPSNGREILE